MPDYNPAIAAGIQAPQNGLSSTFDTIVNLQRAQAQTGLLQLQQALQQRKLNGLAAATQAYQAGEDPVVAGLHAGLDPQDAAQFQNLTATRTGINAAGGMLPSQRQELTGAARNQAETGKIGVETGNLKLQTPGIAAESDTKVRSGAAQLANQYIANPSEENWQAMRDYTAKYQGSLAASQLDRISDPTERMARATGHVGGGLTAEQGAGTVETQNQQGARVYQTRAQFLQGQSPQAGGGSGGPAVGPTPRSVAQQKSEADATTKYLQEDGNKKYSNAQALMSSMVNVDHDIEKLGPSWMGWGAETKSNAVKAVNSVLGQFGVDPISPDKVATAEEFNKEQIRAGMQLINSNFGGSREAASIIQMGKTANAGINNSYLGAKYVSSTIKAAAQREIDLYEYQAQHPDQLPAKSAIDFNKANPPQQYAMKGITDVIPDRFKKELAQHPEAASSFNKTFGPNTAEYILSHQ